MHLHFGLETVSFDCKRLDYTSVFQKAQPGFSAENLLRDFLSSCTLVYMSGGIREGRAKLNSSSAKLVSRSVRRAVQLA